MTKLRRAAIVSPIRTAVGKFQGGLASMQAGDLGAVILGNGDQTLEIITTVTHAEPEATSRQTVRSVLGSQATGTYLGKVAVARGADGTDAAQSVRAMLLSRTATANAKPELEIYADDVACGHGSTCMELDPDLVFLNHGSFGACPRPVFEAYQGWQLELERQPVAFLGSKLLVERQKATRIDLAAELGTSSETLSRTLARLRDRKLIAVGARTITVLGLPFPWLVLGVAVYPAAWFLARWYTRQAERIEQDFAEVVDTS